MKKTDTNPNQIFGWAVSLVDASDLGSVIVNAPNIRMARKYFWLMISDFFPEMPWTLTHIRRCGEAYTSRQFKGVAASYGMPFLNCGNRVVTRHRTKKGVSALASALGQSYVEVDLKGTIIGCNKDKSFDVLIDNDAPKFAGHLFSLEPEAFTLL